METPRRNLTGAMAPALAAAAAAGVAALLLVGHTGLPGASAPTPEDLRNCVLGNTAQFGGPIALKDVNGATVTQADFASKPVVIYFGYTHCPDVCPTTMYALAQALREPGGYDIQPVMITVDPERDTAQVMRQYVHSGGFPSGLAGLTGTRAQTDAAAAAFKVYHQAQPVAAGSAASDYSVDHTSFLYVLDGAWRTRAVVNTAHTTPHEIAQCIAAGLDRRD